MATKKEAESKFQFAEVPMQSEDHEIEVGLKETLLIAIGTAALTIITATSIHAFRERSKRKTYKSLADSVGGVISKFVEIEIPNKMLPVGKGKK